MDRLINIVNSLLNEASESRREFLKQELDKEVRTIQSVSTLKEGLKQDVEDALPFEQKKNIFERLILLERTKANLETYAWWLQLNGGPDHDEAANKLLAEADSLA